MRITKGSLDDLPPGCREAYQRASDRDQREGDGSVGDFVLSVARAVWRAGIRRGREQERARREREERRLRRHASKTGGSGGAPPWEKATYAQPWQLALRASPDTSLCCDLTCDLSGGFAHVGECAPCSCGERHAIAECPATRSRS